LELSWNIRGQGFHGATEVLGAAEVWERRQAGLDGFVDTRAFLRARLLDFLLGDWDRHYKQWRWARIPGKERLQPIHEDRDQAFSNYEGTALDLARISGAQLVRFEEEYPRLDRMTANASSLDRFLLVDLEKPEWIQITKDVQGRLTDEVIHNALMGMPSEYYELRGVQLESILRVRRDGLLEVSESYYDFLAVAVDIHCTDQSESVAVESFDDGDLEVSISLGAEAPYFRRRFRGNETDEIRIYLYGGNDEVISRGPAKRGPRVRVIGDKDGDVVRDFRGARVDYYESDGGRAATRDENDASESSPFVIGELTVPGAPQRDTGRTMKPLFVFGYHDDPGLILGAGVDVTTYGFRKRPWAQHHIVKGGFGIGAMEPLLEYLGDYRRADDRLLHFQLLARASGLDQLNYFGLGNETPNDQPNEFYQVSDLLLTLFPALAINDGTRASWLLGPVVRYSNTNGTDPDTLLAEEMPYGFGTFWQAGLQSEIRFDDRDPRNVMGGGLQFRFGGAYYPAVWDVQSPFGTVEGDVSGYIPIGNPLLLSLSIGGKKIWGDFPFFEAAYLGAENALDGYHWNRFAGDASLYGSVELKWAFQKIKFTIPGELGITVRRENGRVFLSGEESDKWHGSISIALFYAPFHRLMLFEAGVGWSTEDTFLVIRGTSRFLEFD
jgi:hypothetical protein